jgi:predicted nucleic acid-binding protein
VVVVDSNILAYLMIEGDHTEGAQELYRRDSDWSSEAFVLVEFSNVLATYVRAGALRDVQGTKLLTDATVLIKTLHSVTNQDALETAMRYEISAYDARFISVARRLSEKLVTEDARLRRAVPDWTVSLSEILVEKVK